MGYDVEDGQGVETVAEAVLECDAVEFQVRSDFQPMFVCSELEDYQLDFPHHFHYLRSSPHQVVETITICTIYQEHPFLLLYEYWLELIVMIDSAELD